MTNTTIQAVAVEALQKAFETMAFIEVTGQKVAVESLSAEDFIIAAVDFSGPASGTCRLAVHKDLAAHIVENVLMGDTADPGRAVDAVQELANVVCGLILPMLVAEAPDFNVTVARQEAADGPIWDSLITDESAHWVLAEEYPVAVQCVVANPIGTSGLE